jgi:hypothetical protein
LIPTDYNGNIKQHKLPPFLRLLGVPVTDAMKSGNPDGSKMSLGRDTLTEAHLF